MASVAYATRAGGVYLARHVGRGHQYERYLRHMPAAVMAAVLGHVCPSLDHAGLIGLLAATIAAWITRNLIFTLVCAELVYITAKSLIA
jgi:branched-subunit amino acid transport protein